jgi:ASC-1-like (ASCH) protein
MKRVEVKETDNRDISTTDLILDNNTVVEVDVIDLFENMLENNGNEEVLDMFYVLIEKLNEEVNNKIGNSYI